MDVSLLIVSPDIEPPEDPEPESEPEPDPEPDSLVLAPDDEPSSPVPLMVPCVVLVPEPVSDPDPDIVVIDPVPAPVSVPPSSAQPTARAPLKINQRAFITRSYPRRTSTSRSGAERRAAQRGFQTLLTIVVPDLRSTTST
jgi:hypothetical protein